MAGSVNKVIIVGTLGRDPEVRATQSGQKIVNLSVATSERWRDKSTGEQNEKTEWHRVVVFNENLADVAERFLTKGRSVYLEGSLQTRKWTDQSGQEKYSTEIVLQRFRGELVLLGGGNGAKDDAGGYEAPQRDARAQQRPAARGGSGRPQQRGPRYDEELEDSIPF